MEQNLNSNKTPSRPSHEAIDSKLRNSQLTGKSDEQRMDQTAMKAAKRAENRMVGNEERIPGSTVFTK
jgi:hypothetical protein